MRFMDVSENKIFSAVLESLLFVYGEPLTAKKIGQLLEIREDEVQTAVKLLEEKLKNDSDSGLMVSQTNGQIQLTTKPEFHYLGEKIVKEEFREELTPAALETAAVLAYAGPLPRSLIDYLRGVNSNYILRNLLVRGLVSRFPDPQRPHIFLYSISFDFLKHLGVAKPEDLPDYQKYRELLKDANAKTSQS